jgi:hypothetical protein
VAKLVVSEVQTGDPLFDRRIYVTTDDPDAALAFLGEGAQSALLALLSGVRINETKMNRVAVTPGHIQVRLSKIERLHEAAHLELQLETAALAIHLMGLPRSQL